MITVHNLNNSRSVRLIWLLEELGLDFELKQYKRNAWNGLAPDDYLKLHPMAKAPVLTIDDEVLVESGAIIDTVLQRFGEGRLQPQTDSPDWVAYRYWFHASEGTFMPLLVLKLILGRMVSKSPFFLRPLMKMVTGKVEASYLGPSLTKFLDYMETTLAQSTWILGETFTAADIMIGFPAEVSIPRANLGPEYPNISAYIKRLQERPAHKTAMEKNGPFTPMD